MDGYDDNNVENFKERKQDSKRRRHSKIEEVRQGENGKRSKVTVVHKPLFYDTREKDKLNTSLMGHFICCMNKKSMKIYTVKKKSEYFWYWYHH